LRRTARFQPAQLRLRVLSHPRIPALELGPSPEQPKGSAWLRYVSLNGGWARQLTFVTNQEPFYQSLYVQVITAIVIGVLLGYFEPAMATNAVSD